MSQNRVFTDLELSDLGVTTRDLIEKAIDDGEFDKAKRLSRRMYAEWLSMHDGYVTWVTSLLSYIYERDGMEAFEEALKKSCTAWWKPNYDNIEKADSFRRKVEMFAMGLRGHLQPIDLEEDDEKVCLTMRPCGSGERLIRAGGYEPPRCLAKVKTPHKVTFGQSDFPIYCCHTPMIEILQIEWSGHPRIVCEVPEDIKMGGCKFCVYKDPKAVPEKFYTRVGKRKQKV
jgi:hypothetical protein